MRPPPRFYRDEHDWLSWARQLKLTACPHCHSVGTLVRHGLLYGYDERHARQKSVRGHRVLCSNRHRRPGCGRTFSVWHAATIRRLSLSADALWRFLQLVVTTTFAAALHAVSDCQRSDRTWQRLWRRFRLGQSHLRTALTAVCPPPHLPTEQRPAAHVVAHLHAAFPKDPCPLAAFQLATRSFCV